MWYIAIHVYYFILVLHWIKIDLQQQRYDAEAKNIPFNNDTDYVHNQMHSYPFHCETVMHNVFL